MHILTLPSLLLVYKMHVHFVTNISLQLNSVYLTVYIDPLQGSHEKTKRQLGYLSVFFIFRFPPQAVRACGKTFLFDKAYSYKLIVISFIKKESFMPILKCREGV